MPALEWTQGDVSQALEVKFENAEVESLFDQLDGLFGEMLLVTHEGEDHPNGQAVAQRQSGREVDGNDALQREQGVIGGCERDLGATEADIGAHHIAVAVEPLGLAVAFAVENLQALNRPQGLDESRALVGLGLDGSQAALSEESVEPETYDRIEDKCSQHYER